MAKSDIPIQDGRPAKRAKLLDDSASSSDESEVDLKINSEYARRFEHNKRRDEMQRLEKKYGKAKVGKDDAGSDDESSDSEEEDDDGILATVDLDKEISNALNAIRNKDPRVYDDNVKFYSEWQPESLPTAEKKDKPLTLHDYHRKNLLEGKLGAEDEEDDAPKTYAQEQAKLKSSLVKQMHNAKAEDESDAGSDDDSDFMVAKSKPEPMESEPKGKIVLDIENADKDPENFLSNFLAARAWTSDNPNFKPLESDDEDEDRREQFEFAYNMRFEDPETANEKLKTYARDAVANQSVRREDKSGRKKQREKEREKKEAQKSQRDEEKARLRKLKIDEMEEKVQKIKEAAGLSSKEFKMDEWADVLDADWDDGKWEEVMRKKFGEDYYDENEEGALSEDEDVQKKSKKPKKPKWDDDIDIKDIVSEFEDEEKPKISLSDLEDEEEGGVAIPDDAEAMDIDEDDTSSKKKKSKKQENIDAKRDARRERRLIENLVDQNLEVELAARQTSKNPNAFRYRETSPTSFGLTARDILLADDTQLNQFAGLKKLAAWREPEKKKKDKKQLGKKARLREWRKEVFGDEEGPKYGFADYVERKYTEKGVRPEEAPVKEEGVDIREGGRKKKKRSKKRKAESMDVD
ncbi:KRI1-like family C-terminal-domain-containing protein [Phyllosticta citrichinensis]|uniref:KRI1-like family C-terminal-domain-containing protein n=1 Tax=Phyllosticta citrichinensis TaxID=1130410 RepID=A0ABR1XGT9_9PEZI